MNPDQLRELLRNFFAQYYHHPALLKDLSELLHKSGIERDFLKVFIKMLSQYDALGRAKAEQLHDYERLDERLYSLHITKGKQFNIRILYAYHSVSGRRVFLHAFWERRTSDYRGAAQAAYARLKELEEDTQ